MITDGVLLVDKPAGITSAGVVRVLKRRVGQQKIGHLGTLDPFATGLLPLCIGEATKVAQFLSGEDKAYAGRIRLGVETDSLDCTGRVVAEAPTPPIDDMVLERVRTQFAGESWQTPPMYSAVKRAGVPLYHFARRGIEVERAPRRIEVRALSLTVAGPHELEFEVECSKGTYVRVLAEGIGRAIGCGGHLTMLRRTRFGFFDIGDAHALADLENSGERALPLISMRAALGKLRELVVLPEVATLLRRGQQSALGRLPAPRSESERAKVITTSGDIVAIVEADPRREQWRLVRTISAGGRPGPSGADQSLQARNGMLNPTREQRDPAEKGQS
jgi:tRNA pseudouridine55 synthase